MPFTYTIKKSKRAKNISIKIDNTGNVTLVHPSWSSSKHAIKFLESKQEQIANKVSKLKENQIQFNFENLEKIHYLGESLTLFIAEKDRKTFTAKISSTELVVFVPIGKKENIQEIRLAIIKEFKKNFRELITESVEEYNKHYKFKYNRIAIKDNKTNWGSCSSKNNLNFNWKLIFAPLPIIDYVAIHELCHLKEHNHSQNFWGLVTEQAPDYKDKRKWLKENGGGLII